MFNHLMGRDHRAAFLDKIRPEPGSSHKSLGTTRLLELANRYADNKKDHLIKTHVNDEAYPWAPAKAPWAIEQGGSGKAPPGARVAGGRMWREAERKKKFEFMDPISMGEVNEDNYFLFVDYALEVGRKLKAYHRANSTNHAVRETVRGMMQAAVEVKIGLERAVEARKPVEVKGEVKREATGGADGEEGAVTKDDASSAMDDIY